MNRPIIIGEQIELRGVYGKGGWLHFFNLGNNGECVKLAPTDRYPNNQFKADEDFVIPSDKLLSRSCFKDGEWEELGPATLIAKMPERFLVLWTRHDVALDCMDLHEDMVCRSLFASTRSGNARGGCIKIEGDIKTKLFALPLDAWAYNLVSFDVEEPGR